MPTDTRTGFQSEHLPGTGDPDEDDHYSLLGVSYTANHAEITRAYRQAMKRAHPDRKHPEHRAAAEELARRLNAAYTVLADPIKRQAYDRTIRHQVIQDQIMRRYVGGFQTFDEGPGPARSHAQHEPTDAERRERGQADRGASLLLVSVAVAITAAIILALLFGAVVGSLLETVR